MAFAYVRVPQPIPHYQYRLRNLESPTPPRVLLVPSPRWRTLAHNSAPIYDPVRQIPATGRQSLSASVYPPWGQFTLASEPSRARRIARPASASVA
jgi:hypothetical protein